jgi:uncharacterized protein YkwD
VIVMIDLQSCRRSVRPFVTALALLAVLVTAPPAASTEAQASDVARLVNYARVHHDLTALDVRDHLNELARDQAVRMADRGVLFHNPGLADGISGDWRFVGENVGFGPDVRTVQTAFMSSSDHRANILDRDYTRLGTGAVRRGERMWVVQVFLAK